MTVRVIRSNVRPAGSSSRCDKSPFQILSCPTARVLVLRRAIFNFQLTDSFPNWILLVISFVSFFQFATFLVCALIASTFVGDLLINVRSVYKQDKAIGIGFWMTWFAILVHGLGRILYELISRQTCQYWGSERTMCRLHDGQKFGNYLCYLTIAFLLLSLLLKIPVWFFCRKLQLYSEVEGKDEKDGATRDVEQTATIELEELMPVDNGKYFSRKEENETHRYWRSVFSFSLFFFIDDSLCATAKSMIDR